MPFTKADADLSAIFGGPGSLVGQTIVYWKGMSIGGDGQRVGPSLMQPFRIQILLGRPLLANPAEDVFLDFLPPPGLRMCALAGEFASACPVAISCMPRLMVLGEIRRA